MSDEDNEGGQAAAAGGASARRPRRGRREPLRPRQQPSHSDANGARLRGLACARRWPRVALGPPRGGGLSPLAPLPATRRFLARAAGAGAKRAGERFKGCFELARGALREEAGCALGQRPGARSGRGPARAPRARARWPRLLASKRALKLRAPRASSAAGRARLDSTRLDSTRSVGTVKPSYNFNACCTNMPSLFECCIGWHRSQHVAAALEFIIKLRGKRKI